MRLPVFFTFSLSFLLAGFTAVQAQTPNWSEHVAPILYNNCTSCHIEGGIAPFSLVGYQKAQAYGGSIKAATANRSMPPWPADVKYQRYAHERILSAEEIKTIADWVDGGRLMGDTTKAPAKPVLNRGTSISGANLNLKMPDYLVNTTEDEYRCFVLPAGLTQDEFMTALEVIPGNLRVVHHALIFYDTSSLPGKLDAADPKPGYLGFGGTGSNSSQLIGLWVPGSEPYFFPQGFGIKLLKGGNIILQIHYPGNVSNIMDSTRVILKTTASALRPVAISPVLTHTAPSLLNGPLYIPANQVKSFDNKYTVPANVSIFTVGPHMHLIGKSIKAWGVTPSADTLRFFDIPRWDFHWQRAYSFRNLMKVPNGTVLYGKASYDNTSANPNNPSNPPKAVTMGEGTNDEMFLVYFWYTLYLPGDENIAIDNSTLKNVSSRVVESSNTKVYPNPADHSATFSDSRLVAGPCRYSIYDASGRMLAVGMNDIKPGSRELMIPADSLPAGVYSLFIEQGEIRAAARLVRR